MEVVLHPFLAGIVVLMAFFSQGDPQLIRNSFDDAKDVLPFAVCSKLGLEVDVRPDVVILSFHPGPLSVQNLMADDPLGETAFKQVLLEELREDLGKRSMILPKESIQAAQDFSSVLVPLDCGLLPLEWCHF